MTQLAKLRAMDAEIATSFVIDGLLDDGTYTAPAGSPVAVHVFVDLGVSVIGELGQVIGSQDEVVLFRSQVNAPVRGGLVVVGPATYRLDAKLSGDESVTRWVARTSG